MFRCPGVHVQYGACAHVILAAVFVRTLLLPGLWIHRFRRSAALSLPLFQFIMKMRNDRLQHSLVDLVQELLLLRHEDLFG